MTIHEDWLLLKQQLVHIQNEINSWAISPNLVKMLIAAEDHRFNRHFGVDFVSICRALWRTLFCRRREGASTIAMQLVRVLTGRYERTLSRKLLEMYLAVRLTKYIKRDDVPKLYLFVAYYGWRMNGLIQASHRLNINILTVTDFEAASIVARLKYPEPQKYNKIRHDKILARTKHILSQAIAHTEVRQPHHLQKGDNNGTV
ncbi:MULTISPECIES: biosynthetic peptidoglycan transglycosylase [unclassified Brenneria]|uniref:biosynthetic peptidoglycan transglycosylase n=1 Tax=unclassified Brenneria TaxID=2634434 RepID=UPI0018F07B8C|nr:biosynthetic peptidoglycan transglycosylase [Brenneria sp. L3-3C-1]MBJ7223892.1 transglycosylase domain-containing protein [Brenneria sp. L3-3C-1]MEE3645137.1 biosynthetic peptidoglycan transglycosylase [Brenneria sp. L3_3C_1]